MEYREIRIKIPDFSYTHIQAFADCMGWSFEKATEAILRVGWHQVVAFGLENGLCVVEMPGVQ